MSSFGLAIKIDHQDRTIYLKVPEVSRCPFARYPISCLIATFPLHVKIHILNSKNKGFIENFICRHIYFFSFNNSEWYCRKIVYVPHEILCNIIDIDKNPFPHLQ